MGIGDNIRALRKKRGLTQKELGELCGMADSAIRYYESNRGNPTQKTIKRIATALGVTVDYLLTKEAEGRENTYLSPLQQFCMASGAQRFVFLKDQGIAIDLEECKDILLLQAAAYQTAKDLAVALASAKNTLTWFGKFRKELAQ